MRAIPARTIPAPPLARRTAHWLSGRILYSDEPATAARLLRVLLDIAGLPPLSVAPVRDLYSAALLPLGDVGPLAACLIEHAGVFALAEEPVRHWAGSDAQRRWLTWRRLQELVAEELHKGG